MAATRMTDNQFHEQIEIIRENVKHYTLNGDSIHIIKVRAAWDAIKIGGRFEEANVIFQAECDKKMEESIAAQKSNNSKLFY